MYRVSLKTVATFIYWISRLPRGLEIPSWTFFNSPYCVDFRNIQYFIIWWNMDRDMGEILQGGDFKSQHFVFIFEWSSSALMSIVLWRHKRSWVLMSSHDLMAPYSWLILNSHECSLLHGMNVHGCWCVLMDNQDHSWLLLAAFEC